MKNLSVLRRIGAVALAASMVFTSPSMAAFATELEMTGTEVQSQEDVVSEEETQGSEEVIAPEEEYEKKVSSEYPDYQYYVYYDDTVYIQKYTGTDAVVEVPAELDGYPVAHIGMDAFAKNEYLTKVIMPDSIIEVHWGAFYDCDNLSEVVFSKNLKIIGQEAFAYCPSLKEITIPKSLEYVDKDAFAKFTVLEKINFEEGYTRIPGGLLQYFDGLTEFEIPSTVTELCREAFAGCDELKSLTIPDTVTTLGIKLFDGCTSLESVTLPAGITTIPEGMFKGCTSLKSFVVPNTVTEMEGFVFNSCTALSSVTLPEGITMIEEGMFEGCIALETIDIPDTVTIIGEAAFKGTALNAIDLPATLKRMDASAFANCLGITKIKIPKTVVFSGEGVFAGCDNIESVELEYGMTRIPKGIFREAHWLTEIEIPDTVTEIYPEAFAYCVNLKEVVIPEGVILIGREAFQGDESLETVVFPDTLTTIESSAFQWCSSLKAVDLPPNLEVLQSDAFSLCPLIDTVTFPRSLRSGGMNAFDELPLENIHFEEGVTYFPNGFFMHCDWLTEYTLPETITEIGASAFYECDNLKSVVLPDGIVAIHDEAFRGTAIETLEFNTSDLETLGKGAFWDCTSLREVSPLNVSQIGERTFENCTSLESIELWSKTARIEQNAFKNCTALASAIIPRYIGWVDSTAFENTSDFVVYGVRGTFAEEFATERGLSFVHREVPATSIQLSVDDVTMKKRDVYNFDWKIYPENFTDEIIVISEDTNFADLPYWNQIRAMSKGAMVKITAKVGNVSDTIIVTIPQPVTEVEFYENELVIAEKSTGRLSAKVWPCDALNAKLTYTSSNPAVATVNENGDVTGVGLGQATITATTTDGTNLSASYVVTVVSPQILAAGVQINETEVNLEAGNTVKLNASVTNADATNKGIIWSSFDPRIATVDQNGVVTGISAGETFIIASAADGSEVYTTCDIVVTGNGVNGLYQADDGTWYYYVDGKIDYSYTGLVEYYGAWFYVEAGVLNWGYTGLVQHYDAWFYVENGQLNWGYTGLVMYNDVWFYVENGQLNWGYTGLTCYNGAWFYVEGGVLNWGYTGLVQHYDAWFYVENGQLNWNYTGLVMYNGIWFYVEGGQLNWGYTGLTCYNGVWFYVEGGMLNWGYTGLAQHYDAWFYVENGQLNWNYTGLVMYYDTWFFVQNGQLNWGYTGVVQYNGVWFYVENGMLNWGYTGTYVNDEGTWYIEGGIVVDMKPNRSQDAKEQTEQDENTQDAGTNDKMQAEESKDIVKADTKQEDTVGESYSTSHSKTDDTENVKDKGNSVFQAEDGNWYYYVDGKIDYTFTGLAGNAYGVWYIKNGMLDFSYTGLFVNKDEAYYYGEWYVKEGRVQLECTGLVYVNGEWIFVSKGKPNWTYSGIAQNEYGWWYVSNGRLDLNYNGVTEHHGIAWRIRNGRITFGFSGKETYDYLVFEFINGGSTNYHEHEYEFVTNGDTRTAYCSICGEEGVTEYRIAGFWGRFDDEFSERLWDIVNETRENGQHGRNDEWGNPLEVTHIPMLIEREHLVEQAKSQAIAVLKNDNFVQSQYELIVYGGLFKTPEELMDYLWEFEKDSIGTIIDPDYESAGIAKFEIDTLDNGKYLYDAIVIAFEEHDCSNYDVEWGFAGATMWKRCSKCLERLESTKTGYFEGVWGRWDEESTDEVLFELLNSYRTSLGLKSLRTHSTMESVAEQLLFKKWKDETTYKTTDAEFYIEGARTPEEVYAAMLADTKIKAVLENGNYTYIGIKRFNAYTTRDNLDLQPVWSITFGDNDSTN